MVETIVSTRWQQERGIIGFLGWCETDFATMHSKPKLPWDSPSVSHLEVRFKHRMGAFKVPLNRFWDTLPPGKTAPSRHPHEPC